MKWEVATPSKSAKLTAARVVARAAPDLCQRKNDQKRSAFFIADRIIYRGLGQNMKQSYDFLCFADKEE